MLMDLHRVALGERFFSCVVVAKDLSIPQECKAAVILGLIWGQIGLLYLTFIWLGINISLAASVCKPGRRDVMTATKVPILPSRTSKMFHRTAPT